MEECKCEGCQCELWECYDWQRKGYAAGLEFKDNHLFFYVLDHDGEFIVPFFS